MNLFDWTFRFSPDADLDEDAIDALRIALERNGQLCGESVLGAIDGAFRLTGQLPHPDALADAHHTVANRERLAALRAQARDEQLRVYLADANDHLASLEGVERLILITASGDDASPVWAPEAEAGVPLYLLPVSAEVREKIFSWSRLYRRLHGVELSSGPLEIAAYQQMSRFDSLLMQEGRELAAAIEAATGIETYTYLVRFYGDPTNDAHRLCPSCGRVWRRQGEDNDFRCHPCRLVSDLADSLDPEDWTIYGA